MPRDRKQTSAAWVLAAASSNQAVLRLRRRPPLQPSSASGPTHHNDAVDAGFAGTLLCLAGEVQGELELPLTAVRRYSQGEQMRPLACSSFSFRILGLFRPPQVSCHASLST